MNEALEFFRRKICVAGAGASQEENTKDFASIIQIIEDHNLLYEVLTTAFSNVTEDSTFKESVLALRAAAVEWDIF